MRYIKLENGQPKHYSIEQLLEDIPNAVIYGRSEMPSEKLLRQYDVYPLITTPKPTNDVVEEGEPILVNNEWYQTWNSREFTEEEKLNYLNEIQDTVTEEEAKKHFANYDHPFLTNKALFTDKETQSNRYDICKSCDRFFELTKQCKECGCFMTLKTKLKMSSCPIDKW